MTTPHVHFKSAVLHGLLCFAEDMSSRLEQLKGMVQHSDNTALHSASADEKVQRATEMAMENIRVIETNYKALKQISVHAATLEACFDAWKRAWDMLSDGWKDLGELQARRVMTTEGQLLAILNWIVTRPKAIEVASTTTRTTVYRDFDAEFIEKKRNNDPKQLANAYGNFAFEYSESLYKVAVERLQVVNKRLAEIGLKMAGTEVRYDASKSSQATKERNTQVSHGQTIDQEAEEALKTEGAIVEQDMRQLASAEGQFKAIEWCIDETCKDIDDATKHLKTYMAEIQKLQSEVASLRPWKDSDASQEVYDRFMWAEFARSGAKG